MKYKTVVIDPPWPVDSVSKSMGKKMRLGKGAIELPYKTMRLEQITSFPIDDYADNICALFMWTTEGFLWKAKYIIEKWVFKPARVLVWHKNQGITWHGFMNNGEFVIFAYRGSYYSALKLENGKALKTVFDYQKGKHSEKPAEFYADLLSLTHEPRIDIFARKRHFGFDAYGDQAEAEPLTIESFS